MKVLTLFLLMSIGFIGTSCVGDLFQDNSDMVKAKAGTDHLTLVNSSNHPIYFFAIEGNLLTRANYSLRSEERNRILPKTYKEVPWSDTGSHETGETIVVMYWQGDAPEPNEKVKSFTVKR